MTTQTFELIADPTSETVTAIGNGIAEVAMLLPPYGSDEDTFQFVADVMTAAAMVAIASGLDREETQAMLDGVFGPSEAFVAMTITRFQEEE